MLIDMSLRGRRARQSTAGGGNRHAKKLERWIARSVDIESTAVRGTGAAFNFNREKAL
jgi:hypothetical protein